jgi:methionyl-tRNA formyltransferase
MRVIFMGTPEFALPSLKAILDAGYEVPLVVSVPDKPKGRGQKMTSSAVKAFAVEAGLEVATPESLKDPEFAALVAGKQPDVICVVAFRILPESIYSIPLKGSFNLHGSLLPKYRGAAPINWAIINGDSETGVTTFFLRKQVDTGAIILQEKIPIGPEMTAGELHDVMMEVGAGAVIRTLQMIEQHEVSALPQQDELATPAPKIFREDCRIDWQLSADRLHNFIRGLSPHPVAFTHYNDRVVKIYRSVITDIFTLAPGRIDTGDETRILVGTGTSALEVSEIQQEGRRPMRSEEFLRGFTFDEGGRFE